MRTRGFTLIELVITLAIVDSWPAPRCRLRSWWPSARRSPSCAALRDIRTALDAYKLASDTGHLNKELGASGYPPDLKSLYVGVEDAAARKR